MGLPHLYKGDTGPKPRPAKAPGRRRGRAGPAGHQQPPRARGCRQSAPPPTSAWGRLVAFGFCSNKLSPLLNMPQFTSKPSCCQRRDPKETPPQQPPAATGSRYLCAALSRPPRRWESLSDPGPAASSPTRSLRVHPSTSVDHTLGPETPS